MLLQMIIDVPTVGGRLMLVDMAGSENIEQAGQTGMEAKMQVKFQVLLTSLHWSLLSDFLRTVTQDKWIPADAFIYF